MTATVNNSNQILNKKINISYAQSSFTFKIDSNKNISWMFKDSEKEVSETNSVFVKQVSENEIILEWMNNNNTVVNKHINLVNSTVTTNWYENDNLLSLKGTFNYAV